MGVKNERGGGIKAIQTTFDIVELLHTRKRANLTEIADGVGIANSTAHEHLSTLLDRGYVVKEGNQYRLGLKFLDHGTQAKRHYEELIEVSETVLEQLANETSETVNLVVEEYGRAVYIQRITGDRGIPTDSWVGRRKPIHSISAGKAILAYLPADRIDWILDTYGLPLVTDHTITSVDELREELERIRQRGFAINDRESHERVRAVGVPIVFDDEVCGSVSIAGPAQRFTNDRIESKLPSLIQGAVNEIELKLAYY